MKAIPTRTCFVAKNRYGARRCQPFCQSQNRISAVLNDTLEPDLSVPAGFSRSNGYSIGMNIEPDINISFHDTFPFRPTMVRQGKPSGFAAANRSSGLRFRPSVFAGEIDVLPAERRDMGQEIGR